MALFLTVPTQPPTRAYERITSMPTYPFGQPLTSVAYILSF